MFYYEKAGANTLAFSHRGFKKMAYKKIGQEYWLGTANGGNGYFVKYCPCCKESVYLMKDEMNDFLVATYIPRLSQLIKHYLKLRLRVPKIHFNLEWKNPREEEIRILNERIELSTNENLKDFKMLDPKKFSRNFFNRKYKIFGGIKRLEKMIEAKNTPSQIGECFGFSRQRAFDILQAYKFQKVID